MFRRLLLALLALAVTFPLASSTPGAIASFLFLGWGAAAVYLLLLDSKRWRWMDCRTEQWPIIGRSDFAFLCAFVIAAPALILFPLTGAAAPVPKAKPLPAKPPMLTAKDLAGDWQLDWNGSSDQPCWFHADGRWNCLWFGTPWSGTWTLAKGVLTVVEGTAGNQPSLTWTVPVAAALGTEATLTGGMGGKVKFGLRRKVPGKPDA